MALISLAEAFAQTEALKRHLLLGNGFSISLFPKCFTYASLFQEAKDQGLLAKAAPLEAAFAALATTDFESVMEALIRVGALEHETNGAEPRHVGFELGLGKRAAERG